MIDYARILFRDGFETGDVCGWSGAIGLVSIPVCAIRPAVRSVYNSEGLLHSLHQNVAPQSSFVFYFSGRPLAIVQLPQESATAVIQVLKEAAEARKEASVLPEPIATAPTQLLNELSQLMDLLREPGRIE